MSPGQLVCNVFKNERPSFDRYRRPRALAGSRLGLGYSGRSGWWWRRVAVVARSRRLKSSLRAGARIGILVPVSPALPGRCGLDPMFVE